MKCLTDGLFLCSVDWRILGFIGNDIDYDYEIKRTDIIAQMFS